MKRFVFRAGVISLALLIWGIFALHTLTQRLSVPSDPARDITWGTTFSNKFAESLGLNPQETLRHILDELKPKRLRLIAYWNDIEKERGVFDFSILDAELEQAKIFSVPVTLAIGLKVPRWPECHIPEWSGLLGANEREEALRAYLRVLVERYRTEPSIMMWQVENQPYLTFGECPERGDDFLAKEIELVRSLDTRPILTVDGGEWGLWSHTAKQGDVFGVTMYREVYLANPESRWHSYRLEQARLFEYPLGPAYFNVKQMLVRALLPDAEKTFIVAQLQGEPKGAKPIHALPYEKQISILSPAYFESIVDYARKTNFDEFYLWGAEWWYYLGVTHNNWEYWNIAKRVMGEPL